MDNRIIFRNGDHIILRIQTICGEKIIYTITKNLIIFEFQDITIEYKNKTIQNINCKSLNMEFINMSVMATVRMICLYNLDVAYRWFMKTFQDAEKLSAEIYENTEYCPPTSTLFTTSMSRNPSLEDIASRNSSDPPSRMISPEIPYNSSSEDLDYIMTKSIIIKRK